MPSLAHLQVMARLPLLLQVSREGTDILAVDEVLSRLFLHNVHAILKTNQNMWLGVNRLTVECFRYCNQSHERVSPR